MGSWAELDAIYAPQTLTPATALVVALGHLAGATSIYATPELGVPAAFLDRSDLAPVLSDDVLARAEHYLGRVPADQFLGEAQALLNPDQKRCLLLNLLDTARFGSTPIDTHPFVARAISGLGVDATELQGYQRALALKNNLSVFPQ